MLTEITNEALGATQEPLTVTANFYFSIVSSILIAIIATVLTVKVVEPRLGPYDPAEASVDVVADEIDEAAEAKGLRYSLWAFIAVVVGVLALSLPSGAPLRDSATGALIGATPFMASLVFIISLAFLVCGIAYGVGAGTMKGGDATVNAMAKTFASLGGLLVMFMMIAQFIALFNWTNLPTVAAVEAAQLLERINVPSVVLLVLFMIVIFVLDIILPGVHCHDCPKV